MDLTQYLSLCIKQNASDLHLSPGSPPILRVNGELIAIQGPVLTARTTRELIYSIMDKEQQQKFEAIHDIDFSIIIRDIASFRVNVYNQCEGISAVFRTIPNQIPTLDQLGTPPVFKRLLELDSGLILITGPTGCGKSTTLASMIDHLNTHKSYHIITIEDPVEFTHKSKKSLLSQRQVPRDTADFTSALHAALREDPDVILVGELRDLETIRLALTAAETGHLVMATLHTSSAPRAISRIQDVFTTGEKNIIKNQLAESLQAVIYQTLLRSITGQRIAAYEIMLGTPAIRNLIREDKIPQMYSVMQTNSESGMSTMEQSLQDLVKKNIISADSINENKLKRGN